MKPIGAKNKNRCQDCGETVDFTEPDAPRAFIRIVGIGAPANEQHRHPFELCPVCYVERGYAGGES